MVTASERTVIDCTMALGSVALGYGDDGVMRAALNAAAIGHVSGLAHVSEVEIAERLCDVIPCAEQVRFLKSGAEAVSAAVRIARAATGRDGVVACGYFGWHDWSNAGPGIPTRQVFLYNNQFVAGKIGRQIDLAETAAADGAFDAKAVVKHITAGKAFHCGRFLAES